MNTYLKKCLLLAAGMFVITTVYAMQAQGTFSPESNGSLPLWQFLLILFSPGLLSMIITIIFVRYQRAFAIDDKIQKSRRYWFNYTLLVGGIWGVICQTGLQGLVSFLTGIPMKWELIALAFAITGVCSMGAYELLRWWLRTKIDKGQIKWKSMYEWLSNAKYTPKNGKPK